MLLVDFIVEEYIGNIILFDIEIESYCNVYRNTERLCCKDSRINVVEICFLEVIADIDPTFIFKEIFVFIKLIEEHPF